MAAQPVKQQRHFNTQMVLCTIGVGFGSISFGFASAIIATTLGQPSFLEYMNLTDSNEHTAALIGATNSLFYAGGFFGTLFNSWFADRYGRKTSIITGCVIMTIACAICAGSVNIAMFIVFRFFTGWSDLMLLTSVPLWIMEVAPPHGRGIFGQIHALMAVLGYLFASYVGVGFFYYQSGSGQQWRAPLAFACLFPLLCLAVMPLLPESPRWLLSQSRDEEAWEILRKLHRSHDDVDDEYARKELQEIRRHVEISKSLDSSWRAIWRRPSYRKRAFIAASSLSMIYSSGTLVISNYGPTLFARLGFSHAQTLHFQAGIILASTSALVVSMFIVDRIPRNKIMAIGMVLVSIPLAGEAAITATYVNTTNKVGLGWGVAFLYLYIWLYGITLDGPGYYYASEIFPTHLRSKGQTICIAAYSLINIMWTQISPVAFQNIGWKFYLVFICCSLVSSIIIRFCFPDTLNKSLEEIARLFGDEDLAELYMDHDHSISKTHDAKSGHEEIENSATEALEV